MSAVAMPKRFLKAKDLLDELGITEPNEFDLEAIAQYAGATVTRQKMIGAEARIVGLNDQAIITVNQDSPRTHCRRDSAFPSVTSLGTGCTTAARST